MDYQWPNYFYLPQAHCPRGDDETVLKIYSDIQSHFKKIFPKTPLFVAPSGRAAIAMLIRYLGLNRKHTVFAPPWSSHCVWDVVSRYGNPTTTLSHQVNLAIVVHKWGYIERMDSGQTDIVEDSVDSLFASDQGLFPNDGIMEIVSLPKVIGSYAGALVFTRDAGLMEYFRSQIFSNKKLCTYQSLLRCRQARGENSDFESWAHNEYQNTGLDLHALQDIKNALPRWNENIETIEYRRNFLREKYSIDPGRDDDLRFQPVFLMEKSKFQVNNDAVMVRNFNVSRSALNPDYREHVLLPLHCGVSDDFFMKLVSGVSRK